MTYTVIKYPKWHDNTNHQYVKESQYLEFVKIHGQYLS